MLQTQDRKMFINEEAFSDYCQSTITDKHVFNRVGKQVADFHVANKIVFDVRDIQDLACIFTIGA